MTDTIRTFVAIEVPEPVCELVRTLQLELQRYSKLWASYPPPANTHLTLRFLGDVKRDRIEGIVSSIESQVAEIPPFTLTTTSIGAFPSLRKPNVIWLGIGEEPSLMELYTAVEEGLNSAGHGYGDKQFHPHLTLARVKSIEPSFRLDQIISRMKYPVLEWDVGELILMSSVLHPKGAIYKPLARFPLTGGEEFFDEDELSDEEELTDEDE